MSTNYRNILQQLPELSPPDSVWGHIEKELDKEDKRRILPYWIRYAGIAAVCVLLSFFSWQFLGTMNTKPGLSPTQAANNIVKDTGALQEDSFADAPGKHEDPEKMYMKAWSWDDVEYEENPVLTKEWGFSGRKIIRGGSWKDVGDYAASKPMTVDQNGVSINSNTYMWDFDHMENNNMGYNLVLNSGMPGSISNGIYYNADNTYKIKITGTADTKETGMYTEGKKAQGFDLASSIVVTGTVDTRQVGVYTVTYSIKDNVADDAVADADHVPDQFDRLIIAPGRYSKQFTESDIKDAIQGYIDVELLEKERGILDGMRFIEDSMRYQCTLKDSVNLYNFSIFYHKGKEPVSNEESYARLVENEYKNPFADPFSTFSIDVDNASYTNTRRMLLAGEMPDKNAVRIEEFINYFSYKYPQPSDGKPFVASMETASCPWNKDTRLVHIGIQGKDVDRVQLPVSNLVFLVDVSGSMDEENKLPLVKKSLKLLVDQMRAQDRISLVTYAGAAGLVLAPTQCSEKERIKLAIDQLDAGGSTAGGQGLELAYKTARESLMPQGNNRIILVTDGDFNVGLSSDEAMKAMVEHYRSEGIDLTVCGFGMGNLKDSKLETIADYGNGNYYYIDNFKESKKVFASGLTGTLLCIAKDVKLQVEFNPSHVKAYRLVGYENRIMPASDFSDDAKDAGELGAGHTVTAIYEIIPAGSTAVIPGFTELKYQRPAVAANTFGNEMLTLRLRYKNPGQDTSCLLEQVLQNNSNGYEQASDNFRYACGVAVFGMLLRDSKFKASASYELAKSLIEATQLNIENTYRDELLGLIEKARILSVAQ